MEPRKITVIKQAGQGKVVIVSSAETLAQLKGDLNENNISYTDMIFYEGLTKVELLDDASILPKDIPWKGTTTNELVIMLTLKGKKIKSGMDRKEAFDFIKTNNLGDAVKKAFSGKNYTQVKTDELITFIAKQSVGKQATGKTLPAKSDAKPAKKSSPATPVVKESDIAPVAEKKEVVKDAKPAAKSPESKPSIQTEPATVKSVLTKIVGLLEDNSVITFDEAVELEAEIASISDVTATVAEVKAVAKVEELTSSFSETELKGMATIVGR